mgnify:CR=1 FL=1
MKIFLLDSETLFRDGLKSLLTTAGFEVACFNPDQPIEQQILGYSPSVVLMEPLLFGDTVLEVLTEIKQIEPQIKVAFMTAETSPGEIAEAIQSGVDGYITKHIDSKDFFSKLDFLIEGKPAISANIAQQLFQYIKSPPKTAINGPLTEKELKVLGHISQGRTNREISDQMGISENTVKFHLKHINLKLGSTNRTEAAMLAVQQNLLERS